MENNHANTATPEKKRSTLQLIKRFVRYYRPHRKLFCADMGAALIVALVGIVYPIVTRKMLNDFIPNRNYRLVVLFGCALLGLYVIKMLLNRFIQYYGHVMGVRMQRQMRSDMFDTLQRLPFSYYDNHETGKIMTRLTSDLFEVSELAHHGPENILISTISILVSFVYLCTIDWVLTLIVFICVPVLLLVSGKLRIQQKAAFRERRAATGQINADIESSITGIRVTKAFNNADVEKEKFEKGNEAFASASKKAYAALARFHSTNTFITEVFNVVVLIAGGLFLYNGKIGLGDYSAFIVSVNLFISPVTTLINFTEQFQNGVTGFERFLEVMDEQPETDTEGATDIGRVEGHIELKDVTYAYEGNADDVLEHVNLDIEAGKKYALIGSSGGGKTTICHLIPRFYDVTGGAVCIDGKDIRTVTMESLRRNIGIVQQDVFLFNTSIKDNILYGNPGATDEQVIEAAKRANIHDYVMSLPEGYDTVIGERGVRLSGGQKQRLSIARVFLKDPPLLILDEATSALDNTTEILIQGALDELCKGRTTLVVAHRLSTIKNADRIAVIDNGRVAELGTHEELIEKNGIYTELYNLQFRASREL